MFIKFNEESQKILKKAKNEMQKLKHAFVGSEHLMLSILKNDNSLKKQLNDYGITYDKFKNELIKLIGCGTKVNNYLIYTPLLKRVLVNAMVDTKESNNQEITLETIFLSLLDEGEGVAIRVFNKLDINIDNLYLDLTNKNVVKPKNKKKLSVYEFGIDLTKEVKDNKIDPVIGRDLEVNKVIEIFSRKYKNNPLLIGEAGVGKTAIVEELARRITKGMVPESLKNTKIISLSIASLVAGTKYRGEFEERINKMIKEVEDSNIILFIDEIHTIVGAGGAEGAIDASNIIKPALARGKIKLIGATTTSEYKETIENDKALNRRFQNIMINEPNINETITILKRIKHIYEEYHHVKINNSIIEKLVSLTDKYIYNRKNPDKSIDILDEVCAKCSLIKDKRQVKVEKIKDELLEISNKKNNLIINHQFKEAYDLKNTELFLENKLNNLLNNLNKKDNMYEITLKDIAITIKEKSSIPVYDILNDDLKKLNNLDKELKKKIIGQDSAIDELLKITKRINLGLKDNKLPTSILFQGSTGVGKTLLVKEYCKILNLPLIRLDMSEYKESHSVSKIIGSPPGYVGYNDNKNILEKVRNNPYSVILLDEIEKSSIDVINLFLQILDEGMINDSKGNVVSFKNTIIIMTTNLGCHKEKIGFKDEQVSSQELIDGLSIEFVNRIEKVLVFNKMNYESIYKIVNNRINEIKERFKNNNISIKVKKEVIDNIINNSDYEQNGARKINKVIDEYIDNIVIDSIINGNENICIGS